MPLVAISPFPSNILSLTAGFIYKYYNKALSDPVLSKGKRSQYHSPWTSHGSEIVGTIQHCYDLLQQTDPINSVRTGNAECPETYPSRR